MVHNLYTHSSIIYPKDMFKDQCISVTDLRTKTKECLKNIDKTPKFVFLNNHPIAVLLGISEYEERHLQTQLIEPSPGEVDSKLAAQAKRARSLKKTELMNLR